MTATAEISLYPLTENYAQIVTDYILEFKKYPELEVEVNGLSTQIFGAYDLVWKAIQEVTRVTFEKHRAVLVMKVAGTELKKEGLPEVLR